jgi:MFS transporter, FHS family, L-fucose permease
MTFLPHPSHERALLPREYVATFVLVTSLFTLWGFANDITNPMVAAFKNILLLTHFQSSLVQAAFYGGYCVMAIPAALFIRRFSYRAGILTGLGLYAAGCFLFLPAGMAKDFSIFLAAYFVMTSGLAFLETTANPYILALGPAETAPRRLNLAQAFNPVGSLMGMFVAKDFILARLDPADESARRAMAPTDPAAFAAITSADLGVVVLPYLLLGGAVFVVLVLFWFIRLPEPPASHDEKDGAISATIRRLLGNADYLRGVVAQAFYVGVQIMVWTFIIQYAVNELGMAKSTAQAYNIAAMVIFVASRFICTFLLKFFSPGWLLGSCAIGGGFATLGAIFIHGHAGLLCLVAVSAFMSLMFPTIYGIALRGLGNDAKLGSAGLICAIGGGCFMPPLQALIMDGAGLTIGAFSLSATRSSFFLPFLCFVVIAAYGFDCARRAARRGQV